MFAPLLVHLLLWASSPSGAGAQRLEGAWRKNLTKAEGCVHSGLTCKNGGYFDPDACMEHVPCRQTGSQGFDLWETWDLAPDFTCRCPFGFGGVDCSIVLQQERCGEGLVLDRTYDASTRPLQAECHIVVNEFTRSIGLRHHYLMWEMDLRVGVGTSTITLSARNKDDTYNLRSSDHPDGGGQDPYPPGADPPGSKWRKGLAPEAGPRFSDDWRSCGAVAENLKCDMSQCTPANSELAAGGGVDCALSACTSCYPSNPLCTSGYAVLAMGTDGAVSLVSANNDTGVARGFMRVGNREFEMTCMTGRCVPPSVGAPSPPSSMPPVVPLGEEDLDGSATVYAVLIVAAYAFAVVGLSSHLRGGMSSRRQDGHKGRMGDRGRPILPPTKHPQTI